MHPLSHSLFHVVPIPMFSLAQVYIDKSVRPSDFETRRETSGEHPMSDITTKKENLAALSKATLSNLEISRSP